MHSLRENEGSGRSMFVKGREQLRKSVGGGELNLFGFLTLSHVHSKIDMADQEAN